ncbi:hypothetical protein BH11PLA1_BH11PLA1_22890 [soil metagenome]
MRSQFKSSFASRTSAQRARRPSAAHLLGPVICFASLAASPALAQPLLVDFEALPGMTNVPGTTVPAASRLRDQYLASRGVRFATAAANYAAVVNHGPATASGVNALGSVTSLGQLTYSPAIPMIATFFDSTGNQPRVVSNVSIQGDFQVTASGTKTLKAFDLSGVQIASITREDADGTPLQIIAAGIHSVQFSGTSGTIAFDDLRFDAPVGPCSAPRCSPADIAWDNGDPLPPVGPCDDQHVNSGVNEGDYNCFFNTFFTNQNPGSAADIAADSGDPLPPFGPSGAPNNGVNEGDYNRFFNTFFNGCPT